MLLQSVNDKQIFHCNLYSGVENDKTKKKIKITQARKGCNILLQRRMRVAIAPGQMQNAKCKE